MQKTIKLYDNNAYMKEFSAVVLDCREKNGVYNIVLDQTAFFPEEGGQTADTGFIGDVAVIGANEIDGVIYHICEGPLMTGATYKCKINFEERFDKMQNHTGEHIVSGITNKLYGYDNIGFHLSDNVVTLDFNGMLTREQLNEIELLANKAVFENRPVTAYYPDSTELQNLNYRSKLELSENVRIVNIENYDSCACCAPHVARTGEVGLIKLLDTEKNKGGIRIYMKCGNRALLDYQQKYKNIYEISKSLCAKQNETANAVEQLLKEKDSLNYKIGGLNRLLIDNELSRLTQTQKNLLYFYDALDTDTMRYFANGAVEFCNIFAIFTKKENGYAYICASKATDMREFAKQLNLTLNGRGGGNDKMIQGTLFAERSDIEAFFN